MRVLSVFCDESGYFGAITSNCPRYLVALVFHEQGNSISKQVDAYRQACLDRGVAQYGPVHTAPLIRREEAYSNLDGALRKKIFDTLFTFAVNCPIRHKVIAVDKRWFGCGRDLEERIVKELGLFIVDNLEYFQSFDRVVVYYDKGQKEVARALRLAFNATLSNIAFKVVRPADYLLFQVADLACTMALVEAKRHDGGMSKSEQAFFGGAERFKKTYLKAFRKQEL